MAMSYEAKQAMVAQVSEVAQRAHSAVLANYRGLSAGQMDQLRLNAREGGAYLKVVKNNLARIALKDTEYDCLRDALGGPVLLGFSLEDPGSAARVMRAFMKDNEALEVTAISFSGKLFAGDQLDRLAKLPTLDQARAQLMGMLKAPVTKLVATTREPVAKLTRAVAAVRDAKRDS